MSNETSKLGPEPKKRKYLYRGYEVWRSQLKMLLRQDSERESVGSIDSRGKTIFERRMSGEKFTTIAKDLNLSATQVRGAFLKHAYRLRHRDMWTDGLSVRASHIISSFAITSPKELIARRKSGLLDVDLEKARQCGIRTKLEILSFVDRKIKEEK